MNSIIPGKAVLSLCLLSTGLSVRAARIAWVSDNGPEGSAATTGTGGDTIVRGSWHAPVSPDVPYVDQGFVDLLISAGHSVARFNPQSGSMSADDAALLNEYDLVILGAALNSGPFNLQARGNKWNVDIRTPMLVTKCTLTRADRMGYLLGNKEYDSAADDPARTSSGKLTFSVPAHPVFAGIPATAGVMNDFCGIRIPAPLNNRGSSMQCYEVFQNGADLGIANALEPGGVMLASLDFNPLNPGANIPAGQAPALDPTYNAKAYAIAEWPAGTMVRSTQTSDPLAGYRMLFSCGTRDASGSSTSAPNPQAGAMDLTPAGQQMFLNAVNHAVKQPPASLMTWTNTAPGGDFRWSAAAQNWTGLGWADGSDALFAGAGAGTVILDAQVSASGLFFSGAAYSISEPGAGNFITLTPAVAGRVPLIVTHAPATIAAPITGADGLVLRGISTLTIQANNTFTGGTFVRSGTVVLNAPTTGNNTSPFAVDSIEALEAGATVRHFGGTPVEPLTNSSLVRGSNGQMYRYGNLHLTGGTFDLNGEDNSTQWPAPTGTGIITNSSPYARAAFRIGVLSGQTKTFSGVIENGNGGVVTNSIVPNSAPGVTPVTFKQGYRMDLDLQSMQDDSAVLVIDNVNTFTGFTRIGGGRLSFTSRGRWGAVVVTADPNTSTPNGSIICNGGIGNLRVDFNGTSQITGGLSGNGGVFANNLAGTSSMLTVGAGNISNTAWPTGGGGQNGKITDNTTGTGGLVGLTKIGTGTIGLPTALSDYSGPTVITAGVLEFTATGAPSPNSDIMLTGSGQLKLSYAGTKNVNGLYLNGVKQPAGEYSSTTPGITGTGTITVVEVHAPSVLNVVKAGSDLTATWSGFGTLQQSTDLTSWNDVPAAISPHVEPVGAGKKFFRLRL